MSLIDFAEIRTGEVWELFAAQYLKEIGFTIESEPGRGSDGGKDLIVTEHLEGYLTKQHFRWLVSYKHFARSGKSVGADDEQNILERVKQFGADGFLGFYSTLASSARVTRL